MIDFPILKLAQFPSATWLNGISSLSFAVWGRWASLDSARSQYIFSHRENTGQTNQISLRKVNSTNRLRFSVTAGGVVVSLDSNAVNPVVAGTLYHLSGRWQKNTSSGIALRVNGAADVSANTTSQTSDYDSGSSTCPLVLSGATPLSNTGMSGIEGLMLFPNQFLNDGQLDALMRLGWPRLAALQPGAHWDMGGERLTDFQDISGNSRHILAANISTGISSLGRLGRRTSPGRKGGSWRGVTAGAGPAPPGDWIDWVPDILHPAVTVTISGLTDGISYDFKAVPFDQNLNVGADSNILSATPAGPPDSPVTHTEKRGLARGAPV